MKCEANLYPYCKKTMKKSAAGHIWYKGKKLLVCPNCFWKIKRLNKGLDQSEKLGRPKTK